MTQLDTLQKHFRTLRMPTAYEVIGEVITSAQRESWSLETFTRELLEQELEGRRQRRIERLKKVSHLPPGKTLATFERHRLPLQLQRLIPPGLRRRVRRQSR